MVALNSGFFTDHFVKYASKTMWVGIASIIGSLASADAGQAANYYLPYPADKSYQVTQSWQVGSHADRLNGYAVDFGMSVGQDVAAVAPGRVIRSSRGKVTTNIGGCSSSYDQYARYVVIDHGNNESSLYLHLSEESVSVGDTVTQGQIIGKSGQTGWVCGPHLHFTFQKTDTMGSSRYGTSTPIGFVETGGIKPAALKSYTSQNRGISSVAMLVSEATGRPLDGGGNNGNSPYQHPQQMPSNPYQKWQLKDLGNNEYMIINEATKRALDGGGANSTLPYLHPQQMPSNPYQKWRLQQARSGYMVVNVATGRALDAGGANYSVYMYPTPLAWNSYHIWMLK
jgi:murein DD-endopeptidase MepM/ murein hydrolase activator NlpD